MAFHKPSFAEPDFLLLFLSSFPPLPPASPMPGIVCRMGGPLGFCFGNVRVNALFKKAAFSSSVIPPPFIRRMRSVVSSYNALSVASLLSISSTYFLLAFRLDNAFLSEVALSVLLSPKSSVLEERGLSINPAEPGDCNMKCKVTSASSVSASSSSSSSSPFSLLRIFLLMKERIPMGRDVVSTLRDEREALVLVRLRQI
mmetsp:Transcript_2873/g.5232  ORF Transcript_2873/g.5232 Transcript_2873/m.5232 type:complete len:200 (-) Transcript_2873:325-924(-)